jgi:hypothetical protein
LPPPPSPLAARKKKPSPLRRRRLLPLRHRLPLLRLLTLLLLPPPALPLPLLAPLLLPLALLLPRPALPTLLPTLPRRPLKLLPPRSNRFPIASESHLRVAFFMAASRRASGAEPATAAGGIGHGHVIRLAAQSVRQLLAGQFRPVVLLAQVGGDYLPQTRVLHAARHTGRVGVGPPTRRFRKGG